VCDSRDVQETILILVFLVDATHERGGGRQDLIDEDEDGLLRTELDSLAYHVDELSDGQVGGYEVLLLVDGGDVGLFDLFADYLQQAEISVVVMIKRKRGRFESDGWLTGMRSEYFWRMRSASALRFSKGCSSLNLERMVMVLEVVVVEVGEMRFRVCQTHL
jgi:hypothetical protein